MENVNDLIKSRLNKLENLKKLGIIPYAEKFTEWKNIDTIRNKFDRKLKNEEKSGKTEKVKGRIITIRNIGKIAFIKLRDSTGDIQLFISKRDIPEKDWEIFKNLDIGDFIGAKGEVIKTRTGELSIFVEKIYFLSKAIRPLPEKWHGIKDEETKYRQRYLDLIMNPENKKIFETKFKIVNFLRNYLVGKDYIEIDTPALTTSASGAAAKPFITHHNALDIDVYLRIAPETYLKRAIIAGFERVFEFARCFRNEGIDPSHLQDFTMLEFYEAYANYKMLMDMTEDMLKKMIKELFNTLKLDILDRNGNIVKIDFSKKWPRYSLRDLIFKDSGIDIYSYNTTEELRKAIKEKGIEIEDIEKLGHGNLIDELYKKVSRPKLIEPVFITQHPIELSPLARKNDKNEKIVDRFQLVVNTWEIVNAYSELIDPVDQKNRFIQQQKFRESGDEEAHQGDDDYVKAMEYGMPPIAGWGMGIERITALLTQQPNLKDVVLFPLVKPKK